MFYHACTGVSLPTSNVLVTCDTTYRTGLRDNNCGLRNFQRAVSKGGTHFTLNETGLKTGERGGFNLVPRTKEIEPVFENQQVSTTNVVSGYMKEGVGGRQRSLSFLSFFSWRERPLLKGNNHPQLLNLPGMTTLAMLKLLYLSSLSKPAKKLKKLCHESYQNSNRENRH